MASLSLLHHVYDGRRETSAADYAAGWSITPAVGHPGVAEIKSDSRAGRLCRVCGEPLPGAAVHMSVHPGCEAVSDAAA